jgi:hypothetical protein
VVSFLVFPTLTPAVRLRLYFPSAAALSYAAADFPTQPAGFDAVSGRLSTAHSAEVAKKDLESH